MRHQAVPTKFATVAVLNSQKQAQIGTNSGSDNDGNVRIKRTSDTHSFNEEVQPDKI